MRSQEFPLRVLDQPRVCPNYSFSEYLITCLRPTTKSSLLSLNTMPEAPPSAESAVQPPDSGSALNRHVRARAEPALGVDLSRVRVHDSPAAAVFRYTHSFAYGKSARTAVHDRDTTSAAMLTMSRYGRATRELDLSMRRRRFMVSVPASSVTT